MARSKNALLKGASGKIGSIVTFERNGTQVIREYVIPNDPKSPKQLAQRMKLKLANRGLSPLKNVIKRGHIGNSKAYRSAISKAMKNCITGEYPDLTLDYSKVQLAEGKLQLPDDVTIGLNDEKSIIHINWNSELYLKDQAGNEDDIVSVVYFNEKLLEAKLLSNSPKRSDGNVSFSIPKDWDINDIHLWIYLTSYNLLVNSNSLYLGI